MGSHPSPEEAAKALREVAEHRQQASSPDAYPKWALLAIGVLILGVGVGSDLRPDLSEQLRYLLLAGALLLTFLPRWKRAGSAMGYQRHPRTAEMSARARVLRGLMLLALIVLVAVASVLLRRWDVPYPATIGSVAILVTMPLWYWLLNRVGREPVAVRRG